LNHGFLFTLHRSQITVRFSRGYRIRLPFPILTTENKEDTEKET
jgi:hypothetical protein